MILCHIIPFHVTSTRNLIRSCLCSTQCLQKWYIASTGKERSHFELQSGTLSSIYNVSLNNHLISNCIKKYSYNLGRTVLGCYQLTVLYNVSRDLHTYLPA